MRRLPVLSRPSPVNALSLSLMVSFLMVLATGCAREPVHLPADQRHWEMRDSGTTASLRGLVVVDAKVAWASGSEGTFLRTTDGGTTWQAETVPDAEELDFRDVHAWGRDRALLLSTGLPARIFLTDDGGATWSLRYSNETPGVFFNSMAFWNTARGIAVGDPMNGSFLLIETDDGGASWRELPATSRPQALPGEAGFAASGTCLAVHGTGQVWFGTGGPAARVFRSSDWGATWDASPTPLRSGEPSQGVFSLFFWNRNRGIAAGGDYRDEPNPTASAALTFDGGSTWSAATTPPGGFRECVAAVSERRPDILVAVGPSGTDLSEDGGATWATLGEEGFHTVAFSPDGATGIAVGANGLVARLRQPGSR